MWTAIRKQGYWRGELWNRRKDGRVYPQRLTITCVKNELGKTTHYVGDGHDITEEKQAEADRQSIAVGERYSRIFFHPMYQVCRVSISPPQFIRPTA